MPTAPRNPSPRPTATAQEAPPPPLQAPAPRAVAATTPPPKLRTQSPDEERPVPLPPAPAPVAKAKIDLPSPEKLGVTPVGSFDWTGVEKRLQALRAVGLQMTQQDGGWKVVFVLPTAHADKMHRVEVVAAARPEAMRLALEQAESWAGVR